MPVRTMLLLCFAPFVIGALQGCGGDDGGGDTSGGSSLGECPPDSAAQADTGYQALQTQCAPCHLSTSEGASRIGAPDDVNVDDPASVRAEAAEILEEIRIGGANGGDGMPIGSKLSDDTIEAIRVYLACDAAQ